MKVLGLGTTRVDFHLYPPYHPDMGGEVKLLQSTSKLGGSVLNTTIILYNLGASPYLHTQLGSDAMGTLVKDELTRLKISVVPNDSDFHEIQSATSFIFVDPSGERTIYSYDPSILPIEITENLKRIIESCQGFYTSCYEFNEYTVNKLQEIMLIFKQHNKKVFIDLSPLTNSIPKHIWGILLPMVNILSGTANEIQDLITTINCTSISELINIFPIERLYVKMGQEGSKIVQKNGEEIHENVDYVKAKNVTGCGDAFFAGVIWGELNNLPFEKILKLSNHLGKQVAVYTFIPEKVVKDYKSAIK